MGRRGKAISRKDIIFKYASRRDLPLSMRDTYGMNSLDRIRIKHIAIALTSLKKIATIYTVRRNPSIMRKFKRIQISLVRMMAKTLLINPPPQQHNLAARRLREKRKRKSIIDFEINNDIECFSEIFRFQNGDQLRRLLNGFQFPRGKIKIASYRFEAEEILLISLIRLSWPHRWSDVRKYFSQIALAMS
jgi:hypothetical protein